MPRSAVPKTSPRVIVMMQCVFLAMFLVFGIGIVREGLRAIQDRTYTLRYTETTSWVGPGVGGGWSSNEAAEFRGRDAVLFGVGFTATGTMLLVWAAGLVLDLFSRAGHPAPRGLVRAVGAVSLAALLVACVALFPPWRLHTLPLWLVVAAFLLAVTLPMPARWRKKVFPAMVILVIAVGFTGFPSFPIFAGIFVFLVVGTNLLVLWPGLAQRVERSQHGGRRHRHPGASAGS